MVEVRNKKAYEITWLMRRLFRAMSQEADRYLHKSGLTAADRAVMEFLYPGSELTVPEIADRYDVSRQHVQVTVNGLLEKGVLRSKPNPRHKRSSLISLTSHGKDVFSEIRGSESAIVDRLFSDISDQDLETTRKSLEKILRKMR
jgi:DNA-binding MarR family transcriptional regulator